MRADRLLLCAVGLGAALSPGCGCEDATSRTDLDGGTACEGGCAEGSYCCEAAGECWALPVPRCQEPPPCAPAYWVPDPGTLPVDPATCQEVPVPCTCASLVPGSRGRHSSLAVTGEAAMASAYETGFGDLVFAELAAPVQAATAIEDWEILDGAPDGPQVAAAEGYRGGVADRGPDVGRFSSLAIGSDGEPRIACYDDTRGTLKFARRQDGAWIVSDVDGGEGTGGPAAGRYASLVLDADDVPAVAYTAPVIRDQEGGTFRSELRYARAGGVGPAGFEDWSVQVLASAPVPCAGGLRGGQDTHCDDGEVCVAPAEGGSACRPEREGACGECAGGEVCAEGPDGPACGVELSATLGDLPEGVGLFAELRLLPDGRAVVVHHDRSEGELELVVEDPAAETGWTAWLVEGGDLVDAGQHLSAFVDGGGAVHVSYVEAARDDLWYRRVDPATGESTEPERIDDGVRQDGEHVVGADSAIAVGEDGRVRVLYQDQTSADVLLAVRGEDGVWAVGDALPADHRGHGLYNAIAVAPDGALVGATFVIDLVRPDTGTVVVFPVP